MRRPLYRDRADAGRALASPLLRYRDENPLVLGLPRGGVPVAYEIARALDAPLDVWVVRKVGAPIQPELGMGAVAEGGELFLDPSTVAMVGASPDEVDTLVRQKLAEVEDRCIRFRKGGPAPDVEDRTVIVVDDGIATGGTARAALRALRKRRPRKLVLAVPVASSDTIAALRSEVDEIVCLASVEYLGAIGFWYEYFGQTTDDEVIELLERSRGVAGRPLATGVG